MAKERALTLEALRVMDAIDRRGSFAAAADELGRVPSALSYTMQKLEEELDVVLFDRSGHRTKFTNVGRMLLERGRVLLEAADKLTTQSKVIEGNIQGLKQFEAEYRARLTEFLGQLSRQVSDTNNYSQIGKQAE